MGLGYEKAMKESPNASDLSDSLLAFLKDRSAIDPVLIALPESTSLMDAIIVCGAASGRQARGLADALGQYCREQGQRFPRMEGYELGEWILVDCNDVIVHILQDEARNLYKLEDLWGRAARLARSGSHDTDTIADS